MTTEERCQLFFELLARYVEESDYIYHSSYTDSEYYTRPLNYLMSNGKLTYEEFLVDNCKHSIVRRICLYNSPDCSRWRYPRLPFSYYKQISEKLKDDVEDLKIFISYFGRYIEVDNLSEEDRVILTNDFIKTKSDKFMNDIEWMDKMIPREGKNISDAMFKYYFIDNNNLPIDFIFASETRSTIKLSKEIYCDYLSKCRNYSNILTCINVFGDFDAEESKAVFDNPHISTSGLVSLLNNMTFDFKDLPDNIKSRILTSVNIATKDDIIVNIVKSFADNAVPLSMYNGKYFYDCEDNWYDIIKQRYIEGKLTDEMLFKFCQNKNVTENLRIKITSLVGEQLKNWNFLIDVIKMNYSTSSRNIGINSIFHTPLNPAAANSIVYGIVKNYPFLAKDILRSDSCANIGFTSNLRDVYVKCGYSEPFINNVVGYPDD